MTLRFRQFGLGTTPYVDSSSCGVRDKLPVEIQLGTNAVKLTESGWKLESNELAKLSSDVQRLRQEVTCLRQELEGAKAEAKDAGERRNAVEFQNQLLLEMVAVARMDGNSFEAKLKQEAVRHMELSKELERAYSRIINAGLDVSLPP